MTNDTSTGKWEWPQLTLKDIEDAIRKISSPYRKYTYSVAIGFCSILGEGEISVLNDMYKYKDKRIMLIKAGGRVHEMIKKIENDDDIHFERLDKEANYEMWNKLHLYLTDEDGNIQVPPYELPDVELKPFGSDSLINNPPVYYRQYLELDKKVKSRNTKDNENDI